MYRKLSLAIIWFLLTNGTVSAHPPTKVNIEFDKETKILHVRFEHKVRNATDHFIYRILVRINEKDVIEQKVEIQDDKNGGYLTYKINHAVEGDAVEVQLDCVKGGKKSGKLLIE